MNKQNDRQTEKRLEKLTFSSDDLETRVELLIVTRNIHLYGHLRGTNM